MNCVGCRREAVENEWGAWCDECGGVVLGNPPKLFFRHVATVEGQGGRFPIVYDISAEEYGVAWRRRVLMVKCVHCGQQTPAETRRGLTLLDDLRTTQYYSKRGPLDLMLAHIQPIAKGDSEELPAIFASPQTTEEEKKVLFA